MKKTLIAMFALAGVAMAADTKTVNLSDLMSVEGGIMFGGSNCTQSGITSSAEAVADFGTMSSVVTTTNTWYTDNNWSNVGGDKPADAYGITMVTDGPGAASGHCSWIAFAYEMSTSMLSDLAAANSSIALTFNVKVSGGNNNNKGQGVMFNLLSAASGIAPMAQYGNESGTDTAAKDVTLTLAADKVAQLAATGESQKLIFLMTDTDNVSGTNTFWTVTNMKMTVPEPATATLSLLALAGLAARRRRH